MSGGRGNGRGAFADGVTNISDSEIGFENMGEERNFSMGDIEDGNFEFDEGAFEADFDSRFGEGSGATSTPIETDPRATELMTEAMDGIRETYAAYVGYAGSDANLMDLDSTIDSFNAPRVRRLAQEARAPLEKATEYATEDQKTIILSLVQVTVFLEDLARVREALLDAHDEFTYAVERIYAESTTRADRATYTIDEYRTEAQSLYRPLDGEIDAGAVSVFEPIGSVYEQKMNQVRAELDAYRNVRSAIRSAARGIEVFQDGVQAFYDREYEAVLSPLGSAQFEFGSAQSDFAIVDEATGIQATTSEVAGVMQALDAAAQALHRAAEVRVEDAPQPEFFEARRAAERAVDSNDIVADMRTASRIIT